MAFIEPMHRNKPNITYLLTPSPLITHFRLSGYLPRHYTGQPHPRGGGEMRHCGDGELKLATRAWLGGLWVTEGGCLFGAG